MKKKPFLFIGATHGDEALGVDVLSRINPSTGTEKFDWIIGNELAYRRKKRRFINDLNRSAPGQLGHPVYESRRAAEILALAKNYRYQIDLHGSTKPTGIFIIITNPKPANLRLAARLPIKRLVIWPAIEASLTGPLSEYFPCGLEIECGPKKSPAIKRRLAKIVKKTVADIGQKEPIRSRLALARKEIFQVYGALVKSPVRIKLREFTAVTIKRETFYPLLIGSYKKITCYKMKRIKPAQLWPDT